MTYPTDQPPTYPPPGQQVPHYPPAGPPRLTPEQWKAKNRKALITTGVVVAVSLPIFIALAIASGGRSGVSADDVSTTVTSCDLDGRTARVGFTVTNDTDRVIDSLKLRIEYRDSAGARLDTDTTYLRNIGPGDTVRGEESTILDAVPTNGGQCRIGIG